ncbi:MAG: Uma2 family endonuclease [Gemmatimonadaceae bacterium]
MAMPVQRTVKRCWTEGAFYSARDSAPAGERWELVDGEVLVTPAPHWMHQRIILRLYDSIASFVRTQAFGELFLSPVDVKLEPGLVTQPDLLVVPNGELRSRSDFIRHLVLAAEVLSPTSARFDRVKKRPAYQRNRVSEYWMIDEQSSTIERWRPDDERPEIASGEFVWHPANARAAFTLSLPEFFRGVLPEDENADQ